MVQGCLDWQEQGLNPPSVVLHATEDYLSEENIIGRWLSEQCDRDPDAWASSEALFRSFEMYARARNEFVGTAKAFGAKLAKQPGIRAHRTQTARGYVGLKLRPSPLENLQCMRRGRRTG